VNGSTGASSNFGAGMDLIGLGRSNSWLAQVKKADRLIFEV
jgi:hypothetical protein